MLKIGILICGHVREQIVGKHGEYGVFFRRLLSDEAFSFADYFVVDGDFPEKVEDCDAYILTGSSHGAYEDHAFIPVLEDFIRKAYAKGVPQVGICFGHQIMAQALGGRVEKFSGGWGLGVQSYTMDLGAGSREIKLNAIHQDQVVERPEGACVIGSSPFCENAALAYGDKAISIQPHPEFSADYMADLIDLRREKTFPRPLAEAASASLGQPTDSKDIAGFIKAFLKKTAPEAGENVG